MKNFDLKKYLAEGKLLKEVDVLSNEFLQDIQDTMKKYYKMGVDMGDIKDWVNMYYIGYNSEYDEGPGDVDYEGNEFGSEDYESEKKELVFDTAEREDFYMYLNPDAESTFPNLQESKTMDNFDLKKYLAEGKLHESEGKNEQLMNDLLGNQSEVERQLTTKLKDIEFDDMENPSATDIGGFTGYSFKYADDAGEDFKSEEGYNPEIININGTNISVISYNI